MFGLSIGKLLLTVAVIAGVVYGWKWLGRVQAQRSAEEKRVRRDQKRPTPPPITEAVDMIQCPTCGDYVPASGATHCGRKDCPYPG